MVTLTRRKLLAATGALSAAGAGITAAEGYKTAAVSGDVNIAADQAVVIKNVDITGASSSFTRVSDNNTQFQVAVESTVGGTFTITPTVKNRSDSTIAARWIVQTPSGISPTNVTEKGASGNSIVQSGPEQYLMKLDPGTTTLQFEFAISDTATPGSREISLGVQPLSNNE